MILYWNISDGYFTNTNVTFTFSSSSNLQEEIYIWIMCYVYIVYLFIILYEREIVHIFLCTNMASTVDVCAKQKWVLLKDSDNLNSSFR
jgi:hypothetical protein